ncbi:AAA family ATPase [Streptomyces sporangiiformans]|uniref:AAA family ATPase n=1 Tax=Streptomyces sporangiiformans TaxID=2315329 RepID=A0A505D0E9_9ACTN|nr:AAA family ATPase [Streptomyces sporangiiformans]TPQ16207.1 AAA family ATPase [Streptomyces sporangiiformans]
MTAPLTPPPPPHDQSPHQQPGHAQSAHQQSGHHAWQASPVAGVGGPVGPVGYQQEDGPGMKTEVREAAVITIAMTITGLLLGVLWWWLAPEVPLVSDGSVVFLKDTEGEQAIGVDGTFTLLALGFGLVSALIVFLMRRRGGVPVVVALTLGGVLGSLVAWRLGIWLGPTQDVAAHAKEVGKGVTFAAPLELGAKGALLAWSVAALLVHLGLTALFGPRDPDPYQQNLYDGPPA